MPATIRGAYVPLLQSKEWSFDPSQGYTLDQVWKSFNFPAMTRLANQLNFYGVNTTLRFEHGLASLTSRDATGTVTIDKWEIAVDREQPSVFENPIFQDNFNLAFNPSTAVALLKASLAANATFFSLQTNEDWIGAIDGADTDLIADYYNAYLAGVTNYLREKYVLKHTTNAPNRWAVNQADINPATIYSIGQMLSEVQDPQLWVFPLPGYLAFKILAYPVPSPQPNYFYGALKCRSNAITCANNRVDIQTEYIIDQIGTLYYPFAS